MIFFQLSQKLLKRAGEIRNNRSSCYALQEHWKYKRKSTKKYELQKNYTVKNIFNFISCVCRMHGGVRESAESVWNHESLMAEQQQFGNNNNNNNNNNIFHTNNVHIGGTATTLQFIQETGFGASRRRSEEEQRRREEEEQRKREQAERQKREEERRLQLQETWSSSSLSSSSSSSSSFFQHSSNSTSPHFPF